MSFAAAAERKELYRFSVDLGKLALRIAERHGTNADRWYVSLAWLSSIPNVFFSRSLVMYCSMVSAYENVHIRSNLPRLEEATKYANSAGDRCVIHFQKVISVKLDICRVYTSLANFYSVQTKLFIGQPRMSLCILVIIPRF
jgi:biotin synthase-like enzyme